MKKIILLILMILALTGCMRRYRVPITIYGDNNNVTIRVEASVPKTTDVTANPNVSVVPVP